VLDFIVVVHTNARVYRHRTAGPRFHNHHYPRQHRAADTDVSKKTVITVLLIFFNILSHECRFVSIIWLYFCIRKS